MSSDTPRLVRGGEVRERLLARARAAAQSRTESVGAGGLEELDESFSSLGHPLDAELERVGVSSSARRRLGRFAAHSDLSPNVVAVIGALLGLATVASIVALAIHIDPQQPFVAALGSAHVAASVQTPVAAAPSVAPPPVKVRQRKKLPSPWRIESNAGDGRVIKGRIGREAFLRVIQDKGVKKGQAYRVLKAFEGVLDLDRPRHSDTFIALIDRHSGQLKAFEYLRSPEEIYQARENDQGYLRANRLDLKVAHNQVKGAFIVNGSIDDSARSAGLDPGLRKVLSEAMHGHMDVNAIGRGDRLRVIVQEVTVLGEFSRYAGVEALEYLSRNGQEKRRIYYFKGTQERGYYDAKGRSPYEGGWRRPIPGAPVTSPFNLQRMHPVLKKRMPHYGTDFGAPAGTPVHASSFGTVAFVGYAGPAGNQVRIEHPDGIITGYAHLSRFEPGLKVGDKVTRMQVVGYVGSTGRSTGPHLHFSVKKEGKFIDPMSLKLDALRVVAPPEREAFQKAKATYDQTLDSIPLPEPMAASTDPGPSQFVATAREEFDDQEEDASGDSEPNAPAPAPPPEPAQAPARAGSAIYMSDKELLESQGLSDDGEVEY